MADIETPRIVFPTIPASDPRFVWTTGADVQATWRRFGWTPPSENRTTFYEDPVPNVETVRHLRAVGGL